MLGLKVLCRPPAARIELDAEEVADFPVHAVANLAHKFAFRIADPHIGLQRDGLIELKTGARKRDILEIRDTLAEAAALVFPLDVHHVRAQHPGFYTPVEHIRLIGERKGEHYERLGDKKALTRRKALTATSVV